MPVRLFTALLASSALVVPAFAQDKPQTLPTVTVVGTRTGEAAAETAASVDVYDEKALQSRPGLREVRDAFDKSVNIVNFGKGNQAPAIRGIDATGAAEGGNAFIAGARPRATLSIDGRPLTTFEFVGGPTALWDTQQVEVYRGPQTTLQGRNSIAGAIVVETKDPSFTWEQAVQAEIGTRQRERFSGMVSGPLGNSDLAFRIAVDRLTNESAVDFTGPQSLSGIEDEEFFNARGKLLFLPQAMPKLSAQLTLSHSNTLRPQTEFVDLPYEGRTNDGSQTRFKTRSNNILLDLDYDLNDQLTLSNKTTYAKIVFDREDDPAGGQFKLNGPQMTNETLLRYDAPTKGLRGVVGTYVFHATSEDSLYIGTPLEAVIDDKTLATSVFGEVTWTFLPRWHATVGGRYEREKRERSGNAFDIAINLDETFDALLPKAGLAYDISKTWTVGAIVSQGFNAGGGGVSFGATDEDGNVSPDPALGPRSFVYDSEYVWNYELYSRASLLDERLLLKTNLFYSDYTDQQREEQIDYTGGFADTIIVNTPEVTTYGAEVEGTWRATQRLEMFTGVGLLQTEIKESSDPALRGNELARAPQFSVSAGAQYAFIEDWLLSLDARYLSEYYSSDINNPLAQVDPHLIANSRLAWTPHPNLELAATVTNLFDGENEIALYSFPSTAAPSSASLVDPRTAWVSVKVQF